MRSDILKRIALDLSSLPAVAMEPSRLREFVSTHAPRSPAEMNAVAGLSMEEDDEDEKDAPKKRPPFSLVGSVAVVDVSGVLLPGLVDYPGYAKGYGAIASGVRAALADDKVTAVVLRVNSPGGYSTGCPECADEILAARGKKPIVAFAETMAASAAYWVASAADKFYASKASLVGSIGVWNAHVDYTKMYEDFGIKVTLVHAGERKVDSSPFRPFDDKARENMQSQIDAVWDMFAGATATHRGSTLAAMKATQARMFMGEAAKKEGLTDGVCSFEALLAELNVSAAPAANPPTPTPASSRQETKPMPTDATKNVPSLSDAERAEFERLKAAETANQIAAADRAKQEREGVFEKHAKRLTPVTMAKMREQLGNVDAKAADSILGQIPDQVHPAPTGSSADPSSPTQTAAKYASAQDEAIARANERVEADKKVGRATAFRHALVGVLRDDAELNTRVSAERAAEKLPSK